MSLNNKKKCQGELALVQQWQLIVFIISLSGSLKLSGAYTLSNKKKKKNVNLSKLSLDLLDLQKWLAAAVPNWTAVWKHFCHSDISKTAATFKSPQTLIRNYKPEQNTRP